MKSFKLFLLIPLVVGSCSRTYNVTTDSMSNTFNAGQVIKLKNKTSISRGDVVFFSKDRNSGNGHETWLLRVVAFSGDTLEIKDGNVIVNNNITGLPESARLMYNLTTSDPLDVKSFRKNTLMQLSENQYIAFLTMDEYIKVSKWPNVTSINRIIKSSGDHINGIARNVLTDNWNDDQFGPLYIPQAGERIKIGQANRNLYADILSDLQPDSTISIHERLFFLMGDNRSNAADSRFIGLVTESNILGIADTKP
jgi:signal peptidase I